MQRHGLQRQRPDRGLFVREARQRVTLRPESADFETLLILEIRRSPEIPIHVEQRED
jgi:hypothetical protein